MNAIALDNRLGMYSELSGAFSSCESLPILHSTLTFEEMVAIDGLWDWGEFAWAAGAGAALGVTTVYAKAAATAVIAGPAGAAVAASTVAIAAGTGLIVGAAAYTLNELRKELKAPEANTRKSCKCTKCACCK